jgi:hypothetical protein
MLHTYFAEILSLLKNVGVELMATKNRARNASKPVWLVADPGRKRVPREFFSTLSSSTHLGE